MSNEEKNKKYMNARDVGILIGETLIGAVVVSTICAGVWLMGGLASKYIFHCTGWWKQAASGVGSIVVLLIVCSLCGELGQCVVEGMKDRYLSCKK